MSNRRYWTALCRYPGHKQFLFSSPRMKVVAETESEAEPLLRRIAADEWAAISPHPCPPIVSILPGRLLMDDALKEAWADERRVGS